MEDKTGFWISFIIGFRQSSFCRSCAVAGGNSICNYFSRKQINDNADVVFSVLAFEVDYIADPNFVRGRCFELLVEDVFFPYFVHFVDCF